MNPPEPIIVDPSGAIAGGQADFREVPYRVEAGDTLLGIANRFDTTVEAIVRRNSLANTSDLKIGQDLIVPTNVVVVATAVPAETPTTAAEATAEPGPDPVTAGTPAPGTTTVVDGVRTYIVEPGDIGSRIAERFDIGTAALAEANNTTIDGLRDLQPGDRLIIPPAP